MIKKKYEVLQGLPAYGDYPEQFSATGQGAHKEGFAIRFFTENGQSWVGNFQRFIAEFDCVYVHPNGKTCVVVSGGQAYEIDPETKTLIKAFGGDICWAHLCEDTNTLVLRTGTDFIIIHANQEYVTCRLALDGMRNIQVVGNEIIGEAWGSVDTWYSFSVSLLDGKVNGGWCELD